MPRFIYWFLRFSILNPICIRLVGAASRRQRDLYIRSGFVATLAGVLIVGLLGITSRGSYSLRELAAGSAGVFSFIAVIQLILICVLTPIYMAGAITKEADPKTWDIVLTTPLSPLQIVLGNLFGRVFFILALLLGALPVMIATQFFGGVPLDTILQTQLVAVALVFIVASFAIGMSVTRTAGRKAAVSFFMVTVLYLLATYVIDLSLRAPVALGTTSTWTTILTPFNPFLVLEALLNPSGYAVPSTSALPWIFGWLEVHPVAGWSWVTCILSIVIVVWSSMQVRKLGDRPVKESVWRRLTNPEVGEREPNAVRGNPIAWRERVTRHRNIGSLLGRWGFVALFGLAFIILTTLFLTRALSGDVYRTSILYLVLGELIIVTFSAISLASSAIAKEREDGSLDLLLTTSITPKTYLGGKLRGLVLHLLPMVLVPCITMMLVGGIVLLDPNGAVVSDLLISNNTNTDKVIVPVALFVPAIVFPFVVIPYIAFCLALGLLWSMRSKGSVGAIVTSLVLVCTVTFGLSVCFLPVSNVEIAGTFFASLSPMSNVFAILTPAGFIPKLLNSGLLGANATMGISTIVSGLLWSLVTYGLLRSMTSSFVVTVRRLAGTN